MIYCFDLDGTLCVDTNGQYEKAKPIIERVNIVNNLYDNGNTIIIETARGSVTKKDWYEITETQLIKWGVKYHSLRVGNKIYADYYIDDKGINDKIFFKL